MARLDVAPTKSNYLSLRRQLAFAEEGFDLLEQKRQILVFELMSRVGQARDAERRVAEAMQQAFTVLRGAVLAMGSESLDAAALGMRRDHRVTWEDQNVIGLRIPAVAAHPDQAGAPFGVGGTSAHADTALRHFVEVLPRLAALAELENAVVRLARELRKTQRRCNALSKIFIPDYGDTIDYITSNLEERERESFIIMKMIKRRMRQAEEESGHG